MANAFGRTTRTKNRPGHNAGGKRKGAGRPAKLNDDKKDQRPHQMKRKGWLFFSSKKKTRKKRMQKGHGTKKLDKHV